MLSARNFVIVITENIALANKRTGPSLLKHCMYIIALCVGSRARKLCSFSLSLPQNLQKQEIPKITTTSRIQKLEAQEMMKRSLVCSCSSLTSV